MLTLALKLFYSKCEQISVSTLFEQKTIQNEKNLFIWNDKIPISIQNVNRCPCQIYLSRKLFKMRRKKQPALGWPKNNRKQTISAISFEPYIRFTWCKDYLGLLNQLYLILKYQDTCTSYGTLYFCNKMILKNTKDCRLCLNYTYSIFDSQCHHSNLVKKS